MSRKQRILIFFEGPHLAYSPTTIQLYDELCKEYDVTIIAQNPNDYNGKKISGRNVFYYKYYGIKTRHVYLVLFYMLAFFNSRARIFKKMNLGYRDYFFRFLYFKRVVKKNNFDRIICVDISNLFFCSLLNKKVDFLSLEVCKDHHLISSIKKEIIDCVLIQSDQRYDFMFKGISLKKFILPNSPVYTAIQDKIRKPSFIYSGAAHDSFGLYQCLNFLQKFPLEKMMLQGALLPADRAIVEKDYQALLNENRLIIHTDYLENDEVVHFISDYEIGFCFYNFDHPYIKANAFNYMSAPSGKMFKYLAAGVPVICSNIDGFQFVKEFACGVAINSLDENSIMEATIIIRNNYDSFVDNAKRAARHFSFDNALKPYLQFIKSE